MAALDATKDAISVLCPPLVAARSETARCTDDDRHRSAVGSVAGDSDREISVTVRIEVTTGHGGAERVAVAGRPLDRPERLAPELIAVGSQAGPSCVEHTNGARPGVGTFRFAGDSDGEIGQAVGVEIALRGHVQLVGRPMHARAVRLVETHGVGAAGLHPDRSVGAPVVAFACVPHVVDGSPVAIPLGALDAPRRTNPQRVVATPRRSDRDLPCPEIGTEIRDLISIGRPRRVEAAGAGEGVRAGAVDPGDLHAVGPLIGKPIAVR